MIPRILRYLAGGVLLLLLLGAFFLALVFHFPHWLYHYLSPDLTGKIVRHCALTRLAMPARDTDGDGGPDWYEDWTGTDRNDPANGPAHTLRRHGCSPYVYAGERPQFCLYPQIDQLSYHWPRGLPLKLSTSVAILLPPDGTGTPRDELEVQVDAHGYLQFDVVMQPSASGKFPFTISVAIPSSDIDSSPLKQDISSMRAQPLIGMATSTGPLTSLAEPSSARKDASTKHISTSAAVISLAANTRKPRTATAKRSRSNRITRLPPSA